MSAIDPLDVLDVEALLTDDERAVRDEVRAFVRDHVLDEIEDWYARGIFPSHVVGDLGTLGVLGMHLDGYGCAGRNGVSYGLACLELEAGDSGLRSFVSVQGSLAMYPIWRFGSEDAKQRWLPAMVAGEAVGCFALTEPTAGSNPAQMRTFARRDGSDWVLDGHKRWSTNASIADVAVVWAQTDDGVRGFVVPTDTRGVSAPPITNNGMLLALHLGRMKDAKRLRHEQVSHDKLNNVREALTIARTARTVLGAEGITTNQPVMRHMANLESVLTYEGTSEVHILALGKALTGLSAFT